MPKWVRGAVKPNAEGLGCVAQTPEARWLLVAPMIPVDGAMMVKSISVADAGLIILRRPMAEQGDTV